MALLTSIMASAIVGAIFAAWLLRDIGRRPPGLPPGPPTFPMIGNLHQMPRTKAHLQFQKWGEEYGSIYSLVLGTQVMIVLNTAEAVRDLMDKRSAIYSSRPKMHLAQDLLSGGLRFQLQPYGKAWRMMRRIVHTALNIDVAKSYIPYQDLESVQLLVGLLEKPDRFFDHIHRYSNSLTTQIVFGWRTPTIDNPRTTKLFDNIAKLSAMGSSPLGMMLDMFPLLQSLPDWMMPLRKEAEDFHREEKKMHTENFTNTKDALAKGKALPSFCTSLVKAQEDEGFSDTLAGYTAGVLLEAGSETTAGSLIAFVQAMVLYPEIQKKARGEIDSVCGADRLPNMDDEPRLVYVRKCQKETLRWLPNMPLSLPHAVTQDDEYKGYKIPAGATIVLNTWAVHMDANRYSEPEIFDPSRFDEAHENTKSQSSGDTMPPTDIYAFGAGRRACPGVHIAERSMFLFMSRILWAFHLEPVSEDEKPIPHDFPDGMSAHLSPFKAKFVLRSEERSHKIRQEWTGFEALLDEEKQWKTAPQDIRSKGYTQEANLNGQLREFPR